MNMTNPWENNYNIDDGDGEASEDRGRFELWENILTLDSIIVRLGKLLNMQTELFPEEIGILEDLLKVIEKHKVLLDPSTTETQICSVKKFEKSESKSELPDEENLDKEIYKEINKQISVGQQILDAEQIIMGCAKLILGEIIQDEDKKIISKAVKILQNFRKVLK
jgi:hypothetical protein